MLVDLLSASAGAAPALRLNGYDRMRDSVPDNSSHASQHVVARGGPRADRHAQHRATVEHRPGEQRLTAGVRPLDQRVGRGVRRVGASVDGDAQQVERMGRDDLETLVGGDPARRVPG